MCESDMGLSNPAEMHFRMPQDHQDDVMGDMLRAPQPPLGTGWGQKGEGREPHLHSDRVPFPECSEPWVTYVSRTRPSNPGPEGFLIA